MLVLVIVLLCITTWRLTRLLTADAFPPIQMFREWVEARAGETSSWAYLVNCPWCVSVYFGGILTVATMLLLPDGLPVPALVWGTTSGVTGLLSTIEDALNG